MRDNPMGFENKVDEFIHSKRLNKGVAKYEQRLRFAVDAWAAGILKVSAIRKLATLQ